MRRTFAILLLPVLALAAGCSIANAPVQVVALNVTPQDATVIANGMKYEGSPVFFEVRRDRDLLINAAKSGYEPYNCVVGYHLSSLGKIDAWSSILIFPFFGLFSPGAWELDQTTINIQLHPLETKPVSETVILAKPTPDAGEETVVESTVPVTVNLNEPAAAATATEPAQK